MEEKKRGRSPVIINDKRYCTHHCQFATVEGGDYITFNRGLNRRWICAQCLAKKKERREE